MQQKKRQYKLLSKAYDSLETELKADETLSGALDLLTLRMRRLRDRRLLSGQADGADPDNPDTITVSLNAALTAYDKAQTCIEDYFDLSGRTPVARPAYKDEETAEKEYERAKEQNEQIFWSIVMTYMEEWLNAEAE